METYQSYCTANLWGQSTIPPSQAVMQAYAQAQSDQLAAETAYVQEHFGGNMAELSDTPYSTPIPPPNVAIRDCSDPSLVSTNYYAMPSLSYYQAESYFYNGGPPQNYGPGSIYTGANFSLDPIVNEVTESGWNGANLALEVAGHAAFIAGGNSTGNSAQGAATGSSPSGPAASGGSGGGAGANSGAGSVASNGAGSGGSGGGSGQPQPDPKPKLLTYIGVNGETPQQPTSLPAGAQLLSASLMAQYPMLATLAQNGYTDNNCNVTTKAMVLGYSPIVQASSGGEALYNLSNQGPPTSSFMQQNGYAQVPFNYNSVSSTTFNGGEVFNITYPDGSQHSATVIAAVGGQPQTILETIGPGDPPITVPFSSFASSYFDNSAKITVWQKP
jgi:hypothetical protein